MEAAVQGTGDASHGGLCYFDGVEDGYYTLTAGISADKRRIIWEAKLSIQLSGIPLDARPFQDLCEQMEVQERIHFRPRSEKSVDRGRPPRNADLPLVTPVAFIVETPDSDVLGHSEWIVGIVVENPFVLKNRAHRTTTPTWVPEMLTDSEYLICSLRSWHQADGVKSVYELWEIESAWTSEALIVNAIADWQNEGENGGLHKRASPEPQCRRSLDFLPHSGSDDTDT